MTGSCVKLTIGGKVVKAAEWYVFPSLGSPSLGSQILATIMDALAAVGIHDIVRYPTAARLMLSQDICASITITYESIVVNWFKQTTNRGLCSYKPETIFPLDDPACFDKFEMCLAEHGVIIKLPR